MDGREAEPAARRASGAPAEVRAWAVRLRAIAEERDRLATFWGPELRASDHPDRGLLDRLDTESTTLQGQLDHEVAGLQAEGIEVKDLDSGLVDFYAVLDQEVVFLCWRRGEPDVGYFHRLDGGFRTRRPIVSTGRRRRRRTPNADLSRRSAPNAPPARAGVRRVTGSRSRPEASRAASRTVASPRATAPVEIASPTNHVTTGNAVSPRGVPGPAPRQSRPPRRRPRTGAADPGTPRRPPRRPRPPRTRGGPPRSRGW